MTPWKTFELKNVPESPGKVVEETVSETLRSKGFTVETAYDGAECFKRFFEVRPDVLIADDHTPVLFLTAKSTPDDVVTGFELGANDYLKKPFAIQELIVRIKALMGKAYMTERQEPEQNEYPLGDYRFTPSHRSLFRLSQWHLLENPLGNGPLVTQLFAPYPSPFHRNTKYRLMR